MGKFEALDALMCTVFLCAAILISAVLIDVDLTKQTAALQQIAQEGTVKTPIIVNATVGLTDDTKQLFDDVQRPASKKEKAK